MNRLLLILILLFLNNCSTNKSKKLFEEKVTNVQSNKDVRTVLAQQERGEEEFNQNIEMQVSQTKLSINSDNNQNDIGELDYKGLLEKIGKYNYAKFDKFEYINSKPIFYEENIIFFDKKGTIILYDQNQRIIWKKNFYNKSEKKIKPRLNLSIQKDTLIIVDNVAKYYAIDLKTGEILWSKKNIVPFNSDIKIKDNVFYVVDYKNILRAISIKDGSEQWSVKTEESLTKSNIKLSIVIDSKNIYFNNSIGDITAVNIKSGQLLWQLPTQSNNISENAFQLSSSKLVINENSILLSNNKNEFYSIDTKTGLINWKNELSSILKPIVVGKFIVTISENGYFYLLDKNSGDILRINNLYKQYNIKKKNKTSPTGFLVALGKVYLANSDGKFIIADLNTGNILKIVKISGHKISGPYIYENNLFLIKNGSIVKFN